MLEKKSLLKIYMFFFFFKEKEKENVYLIPQEPKKPSTAYTLFFRDFFYERHKKNPEDKVTEIARLAGNEWVKLSAEEKNVRNFS